MQAICDFDEPIRYDSEDAEACNQRAFLRATCSDARFRNGQLAVWDVVGPVCETADFLGKNRELALTPGDLLAVSGAGAYGFTMSSNYNSRPRAAEVIVDGAKVHLARERESIADIMRGEHCLPE